MQGLLEEEHRDIGAKLEILGKTFGIYGGLNTIGRNKEAVVNLKHLGISQHHAVFILVDDDLHFISDLKSSNGTYLNGRKLVPLQLYQLESGSQVKFANIEGIYSKCDPGSEPLLSTNTQDTQDFTQTFYGGDTQLITDSFLGSSNRTQLLPTQRSHYIPTQVLLKVASDLETSYQKLHEQATQLFTADDIHKNKLAQVNSNKSPNPDKEANCEYSDKSTFDLHEAETQKIVTVDPNSFSKSNGAEPDPDDVETQIIEHDNKENSSEGANNSSLVQIIDKKENSELSDTKIIDEIQVCGSKESSDEMNLVDTPRNIHISQSSSLDDSGSEIIRPVKMCINPFAISQEFRSESPEVNLDDSGSDIIRPVKLSVNPFYVREDSQVDVLITSRSAKVNIHDDSESDIIRPVRNSMIFPSSLESQEKNNVKSQEAPLNSDNIEEIDGSSNDSLDFMTMQKLSDIEKKCVGSKDIGNNEVQISEQKNEDNDEVQDDGSETDNETSQGKKRNVSECETDNEKVERRKKQVKCSREGNEIEISDKSKRHQEEINGDSNSDSDSDIVEKRKRKHTKKKKIIIDSDSDTDIEDKSKKAESDSDTGNRHCDISSSGKSVSVSEPDKIAENNISSGNSVRLSIGSVSLFLEDKEIDETKIDNTSVKGASLELRNNETLDESDIILATQEDFRPSKLTSQISALENSEESFKLGLTQMMEEEKQGTGTSQTNVGNLTKESDTQNNDDKKELEITSSRENTNKKFVFKKKPAEAVVDANTFFNSQDDDIYQAGTQKMSLDSENKDKDKMCSLPKQKVCEVKKYSEKDLLDGVRPLSPEGNDEILYIQSTQVLGEESDNRKEESEFKSPLSIKPIKSKKPTGEVRSMLSQNPEENDEDFYLHPTQKLGNHLNTSANKVSPTLKKNDDNVYLQPTQKIDQFSDRGDVVPDEVDSTKHPVSLSSCDRGDHSSELNHDYMDDDDLFATQKLIPKDTPTKAVESELENMFATQSVLPSEESLDGIKNILCQRQVVDAKLPRGDSDLEAILATQKLLDSPRSSKSPNRGGNVNVLLGRSVESQLEVLFTSQKELLPKDEFVRPVNPLVNVFGLDSQNSEDKQKITGTTSDAALKDLDNSEVSENGSKSKLVGLEQSFALLESKSTKIRRSARNKTYEEITVNCPKPRVSMVIAEKKKIDVQEDHHSENDKNSRKTRKRTPSISSDTTNIIVKETKEDSSGKRRKTGESSVENKPIQSSKIKTLPKRKDIPEKIKEEEIDDLREKTPITTRRTEIRRIEATTRRSNREKAQENQESTTLKRKTQIEEKSENVTKKAIVEPFIRTRRSSVSSNGSDSKDCPGSSIARSNRKGSGYSRTMQKIEEDNCDNNTSSNKKLTKTSTDTKSKTNVENDNDKTTSSSSKSARGTRTSRLLGRIQEPDSGDFEDDKFSNNVKITLSVDDKSKLKVSSRSRRVFESEEEISVKSEIRSREKQKLTSTATDMETADLSRSSSKSSIHDFDNSPAKRSLASSMTTPSKVKRTGELPIPSSKGKEAVSPETPNKSKRKLKPKVVFTMLESPPLESAIKRLGGSVVDSVDACTVLITTAVKRTMKLLSAVGSGKPICSQRWIEESKQKNEFLDPWEYLLIDKEAEKKWDFSLRTSLLRSSEKKLLEGFTFQLLVTTALDVLKGAIESSGGKVVTRAPKEVNNFIVVSSPDQKEKYKKLLKQRPNLTVVEPEAIFDGVLRQEIRFERHLLK